MSDGLSIYHAAAAFLSALSAVLAWIAKLRWSKEYSEAKEAQIQQLNSQIKLLQDMTPMKVEQYFHSVKRQLEGQIDDLEKQLAEKSQTAPQSIELSRDLAAVRAELLDWQKLAEQAVESFSKGVRKIDQTTKFKKLRSLGSVDEDISKKP